MTLDEISKVIDDGWGAMMPTQMWWDLFMEAKGLGRETPWNAVVEHGVITLRKAGVPVARFNPGVVRRAAGLEGEGS